MAAGEAPRGRRGVVAFDVDGVLLKGLFLSRAAARRGPLVWIRSAWLGLLLKLGVLSVRTAVERAYRLQRGATLREFEELGRRLPLARGAAEVCGRLRAAGYTIVLVSVGVPDLVVQTIAARVGADRASGAAVETDQSGVLTGRLLGGRHSEEGKRDALDEMLADLGFAWTDATVVVDDKSNSEIVSSAWRSVAVNPELPILSEATFVLHTRNLSEILEFFPEGYDVGITPQWMAVRHEVFRKGIHVCAVVVPLVAAWSREGALALVGATTVLFLVSELARLGGLALPLFSNVTWRAMRSTEARGVALGPVLFGVGIWLTLFLFPLDMATAGILVLAVGDTAASLVGKAFGRTLLPHNPGKTVVGSLSLFAVGVVIAIFYLPLPWAILVGTVAAVVESLPIGAYDNLLLPLATSASLSAFAGAVG
ncbi:MAG: HAD-IB family phosphatase [Candidatus Eisenbacteria bacterium]|nr:HAD-IB family phosphatase [Candidatus Eisenbacteria bacterium]